jgi:hypothetical protein
LYTSRYSSLFETAQNASKSERYSPLYMATIFAADSVLSCKEAYRCQLLLAMLKTNEMRMANLRVEPELYMISALDIKQLKAIRHMVSEALQQNRKLLSMKLK